MTIDPSTGVRGFEPGRQDLAYASQSCFQERQPHYRAAHFLYLPAITVFSPNRNITNLEPDRNQRACHSQDSNAFVVDRRPVNSTVGCLRFVFADLLMKGCDLSAAELKERDMKHSLFAAAILLSLLLALTIYAQKQTATKVAWEYHVWSFNNWAEATGKLNEDGNQGWELVTVTETPTTSERAGSVTIYLKRAK